MPTRSLVVLFTNILIVYLVGSCSPRPVPVTPMAPMSVGLELVAEGLHEPDLLISPPDGSKRRFIKDQLGTIHILTPEGTLLSEPFLDLRDRLTENKAGPIDFRGLVGFTFHPEFAANGRFFVFYTAHLRSGAPAIAGYTSVLAEFRVSPEDPNRADLDSERILLELDQPDPTNAFAGGALVFGPLDGYLYITVGTDSLTPITNPETLHGKILRIDVDNGDPYGIPADNPFLDTSMPDEVYSLGLRNGLRMSADAQRGEIYMVDERFTFMWSKVSLVTPGADFGWQAQAGKNCFTSDPTVMLDNCLEGKSGEVIAPPIVEYASDIGVVISGAVMYRGTAIPDLQGKLIVADSGATSGSGGHQGILLAASPQPAGTDWLWPYTQLEVTIPDETARFFWSLGQDADGEIYVTTIQLLGGGSKPEGKVFKIIPAP